MTAGARSIHDAAKAVAECLVVHDARAGRPGPHEDALSTVPVGRVVLYFRARGIAEYRNPLEDVPEQLVVPDRAVLALGQPDRAIVARRAGRDDRVVLDLDAGHRIGLNALIVKRRRNEEP